MIKKQMLILLVIALIIKNSEQQCSCNAFQSCCNNQFCYDPTSYQCCTTSSLTQSCPLQYICSSVQFNVGSTLSICQPVCDSNQQVCNNQTCYDPTTQQCCTLNNATDAYSEGCSLTTKMCSQTLLSSSSGTGWTLCQPICGSSQQQCGTGQNCYNPSTHQCCQSGTQFSICLQSQTCSSNPSSSNLCVTPTPSIQTGSPTQQQPSSNQNPQPVNSLLRITFKISMLMILILILIFNFN